MGRRGGEERWGGEVGRKFIRLIGTLLCNFIDTVDMKCFKTDTCYNIVHLSLNINLISSLGTYPLRHGMILFLFHKSPLLTELVLSLSSCK